MSNNSAIAKVQTNLSQLFQSNLTPGDAYIKFQITSNVTALLSMERVQESLFVEAKKITPLPSMPSSVLGIMSSRDRVFCVFDLAQLLKLPSWSIPPRQHQIIVLETQSERSIYIGFAITQLQGIMRLSPEQIQSARSFSQAIDPYLDGLLQTETTTIPILSFDLILNTLSSS